MTQKDIDFVNLVKANTKQLWIALNGLRNAQRQWNASNYTNTLPNDIVPAAQVSAVIFDTLNVIDAALTSGHQANLANLL